MSHGEIGNDFDEDDTASAWDQLEQEERRQREVAALERSRVLLEEFRRTSAEYAEWNANWTRRMQQLNRELLT